MNQGEILLKVARASISGRLGIECPEPQCPESLLQPGATFVTLTLAGQLRGCIGTLEALRPIFIDAKENAISAAFSDPRFLPLQKTEFDSIRIEVSLLSETEPIRFSDEEDALRQLRPGHDGLVFSFGRNRSTFLPQVWESLPEPAEFLFHLKRKAGLPGKFWSEEIRLSRYAVSKWKEQ